MNYLSFLFQTEFNVFSVHGDGKKIDGEFEARKVFFILGRKIGDFKRRLGI